MILEYSCGFFRIPLKCRVISSTNRDSLTFFFPIHIPFISFSYFITLFKISI
jgi:hypothetical protein